MHYTIWYLPKTTISDDIRFRLLLHENATNTADMNSSTYNMCETHTKINEHFYICVNVWWLVCMAVGLLLEGGHTVGQSGPKKKSFCPCEEWEFTVPAHESLKLPRNNAENAGNVLTCCIVQFYLQCMYESRDLHTEAHAFCTCTLYIPYTVYTGSIDFAKK